MPSSSVPVEANLPSQLPIIDVSISPEVERENVQEVSASSPIRNLTPLEVPPLYSKRTRVEGVDPFEEVQADLFPLLLLTSRYDPTARVKNMQRLVNWDDVDSLSNR